MRSAQKASDVSPNKRRAIAVYAPYKSLGSAAHQPPETMTESPVLTGPR
jgi:hypothetical protein